MCIWVERSGREMIGHTDLHHFFGSPDVFLDEQDTSTCLLLVVDRWMEFEALVKIVLEPLRTHQRKRVTYYTLWFEAYCTHA